MPLRPIRSPANMELAELTGAGPTPRGQRAHGRDDAARHKPPSREATSFGTDLRAYGRPWIPASSSRPQIPTGAPCNSSRRPPNEMKLVGHISALVRGCPLMPQFKTEVVAVLAATRSISVLGTSSDTLGWETRAWAPAKWSSFAGPPARQGSLLNTQLPPLLTTSGERGHASANVQKDREAKTLQHNLDQQDSSTSRSDTSSTQPLTKLTSAHLNDMNDPRRLSAADRIVLPHQQPPKKYQALIADGLGR